MLHGYRLFSEEIFNEYAAQTMFFQRQAFLTEKKPESARFCLAFFDFQKKPKVLKKARISKAGFKQTKLATLHLLTAPKRTSEYYVMKRFVGTVAQRSNLCMEVYSLVLPTSIFLSKFLQFGIFWRWLA